jgi:hypothetical protein
MAPPHGICTDVELSHCPPEVAATIRGVRCGEFARLAPSHAHPFGITFLDHAGTALSSETQLQDVNCELQASVLTNPHRWVHQCIHHMQSHASSQQGVSLVAHTHMPDMDQLVSVLGYLVLRWRHARS